MGIYLEFLPVLALITIVLIGLVLLGLLFDRRPAGDLRRRGFQVVGKRRGDGS